MGTAQGGGEERRWGCWRGFALRLAASRHGGAVGKEKDPEGCGEGQGPGGCTGPLISALGRSPPETPQFPAREIFHVKGLGLRISRSSRARAQALNVGLRDQG